MPSYIEPPSQMPSEAGKVYGYLSGEIIRTRGKWILFSQLFMENSTRTQKLKKAGAHLFGEIQNILIHDLILSLSRLSDPAKTLGKDNLTLLQLVQKLETAGEAELAAKLKTAYDASLKKALASVRVHRTKKVAHFDLVTVVDPETQPLPGLSLREIREAIESIESFLSIAHAYYTKGTVAWDMLRLQDDAHMLMSRLCKAECYDDAVEKGLIQRNEWKNKWE